MDKRRITILGSTGSIGTQVLDVVREHGSILDVAGLSARSSVDLLIEQALEFQPSAVHVGEAELVERVQAGLAGTGIGVLSGGEGLCALAAETDAELVVTATVGWAGVEPTLAAIGAGREIALANKEVLVCAGDLVLEAARARGVAIWPLDSEHNAIMQCLDAGKASASAPIRRIILTCSGGAFRDAPEEMATAGRERTLAHPTWSMGPKITVDSATLMNKGFEVIEAHHLFGIPLEKIEVIIHPQSIVHSIVEFVDGSMIAQMGHTDMRLPIQNVLTQPYRRPTTLEPLDLAALGSLEFSAPDLARYPCLGMAYEAAERGGSVPCVLNAANEVAVAAHLADEIPCGSIPAVLRQVLDCHGICESPTLSDLRAADGWAREKARDVLTEMSGAH